MISPLSRLEAAPAAFLPPRIRGRYDHVGVMGASAVVGQAPIQRGAMRFRPVALTLALLGPLSALGCCAKQGGAATSRRPEPRTEVLQENDPTRQPLLVAAVVEELRTAPSWLQLTTAGERQELVHTLKRVASRDPSVVRLAIQVYLSDAIAEDYVLRQGNVLVLNRLIFAVPSEGPVLHFNDWNGPPDRPLWPLEQEHAGLRLVGRPHMHFGPLFDGLAEFDYCWAQYGLRKRPIEVCGG
jgi:hypothetical protein